MTSQAAKRRRVLIAATGKPSGNRPRPKAPKIVVAGTKRPHKPMGQGTSKLHKGPGRVIRRPSPKAKGPK